MNSRVPTIADPAAVVQDYLASMERRDLAHANSLLGPGFNMVFPGGHRMDSLETLVERSKGRYRSAKKRFDRYDVAPQADGSAVVYCYGTLYGELNDGSTYENIRFIDRFTVKDGKLLDQKVWNDMAEILGDKLKAKAG